MAYYHILKKRRLDLNLSVQDIAIQTHLAPEYIRAIEENNLDVFSDDFSFVRYFTRAYCEAIGVNWEVIAPEVDATISLYARAKDQALTQAQRRMVENMPSSKNRTRQKSKKKSSSKMHKVFAASAGKISRTLSWDSKNKMTKTLIIGGGCLIIFLIALNTITDAMAQRTRQNAQAAKEQELLEKEKETQRLAQQLQAQKSASGEKGSSLVIAADPNIENHFNIAADYALDKKFKLDFTITSPTHIEILVAGSSVYSQEVSANTSYDLPITGPATVEIRYSAYADGDALTVDSTPVPLNGTALKTGKGIVTLVFMDPAQTQKTDPSQAQAQQAQSNAEQNGEAAESEAEQPAEENQGLEEYQMETTDGSEAFYEDQQETEIQQDTNEYTSHSQAEGGDINE